MKHRPLRAGDFRHAIYVLVPTLAETAKGDRVATYPAVPPLDPIAPPQPDDWASIEPLVGRELVFARGVRADLTHKIALRYRRITPLARIAWDDGEEVRIFEIGPEVSPELRGWAAHFYAFEVR